MPQIRRRVNSLVAADGDFPPIPPSPTSRKPPLKTPVGNDKMAVLFGFSQLTLSQVQLRSFAIDLTVFAIHFHTFAKLNWGFGGGVKGGECNC